jgi:micrococcal nuclease
MLFWISGLVLLSLACAAIQALPTIDVQRAVELTVTAISATFVNTTPVPPSPQTPTATPSPQPATQQVPGILDIHACSLKNPQFEIGLVNKVVDGDTIDVTIDGETEPVRYLGIDSPESGQPFWREGRDGNQALVEDELVTLVRDISDRDKFNRLLRYVFLKDGTFVNEELVKQGFARAIAYPPDTACEDLLNLAEQEAQKQGLGIWAEAEETVSPTPITNGASVMVEPTCSQFNAPGDDNKNKNEEYVCLMNPGSQAVGMEGWTIEDEYGWTYTFPPFSLEAGSSVQIHTGCGTDTAEDLFWCRTETAIWNNSGDCVHLKNEEGEILQDFCY